MPYDLLNAAHPRCLPLGPLGVLAPIPVSGLSFSKPSQAAWSYLPPGRTLAARFPHRRPSAARSSGFLHGPTFALLAFGFRLWFDCGSGCDLYRWDCRRCRCRRRSHLGWRGLDTAAQQQPHRNQGHREAEQKCRETAHRSVFTRR